MWLKDDYQMNEKDEYSQETNRGRSSSVLTKPSAIRRQCLHLRSEFLGVKSHRKNSIKFILQQEKDINVLQYILGHLYRDIQGAFTKLPIAFNIK